MNVHFEKKISASLQASRLLLDGAHQQSPMTLSAARGANKIKLIGG
jgi:hypothetical protein